MKEITPDNQGIGKISQTPRPGQTSVRGNGLTGEFSRILSEQLDPGQELSSAPETAGGLPELDGTYASKMIEAARPDTTWISEKITGAIDMLDKYAGSLADPGTTLKQASALLEEISSRTADINKDLETTQTTALETGNPKIKEIMAHLDTVVALEKIKINRGDYS